MSLHTLQTILDTHDGSRMPKKPVIPKPVREKRVIPPKPDKPAFKGLLKSGTQRVPTFKAEKRVFKMVMSIIALKAQGMNHKEISELLQISEQNIKSYLFRANARGQLNMTHFDDPDDQMNVIIRSQVTRNVNEFLESRDKTVTLEALKIFNPPSRGDQPIQQNQMVLQVKVELPQALQNSSTIQIREGTIGGAIARRIPVDAEIIETE